MYLIETDLESLAYTFGTDPFHHTESQKLIFLIDEPAVHILVHGLKTDLGSYLDPTKLDLRNSKEAVRGAITAYIKQ